jgi:hypothetical protein
MSSCGDPSSAMYLCLDRFQKLKLRRMRCLLQEIMKAGEMPVPKFISYVANRYGLRRATAEEYLDEWLDGGYVSIQDNIIKFIKKPEWWK